MIEVMLMTVGLLQPVEIPDSLYADTETSTNVTLVPLLPDYREYRFTIAVEGSLSNNVEIALGPDSNSNGILDMSEYERIIGWDAGVWKDLDVLTGNETIVGTNGTERSWSFGCDQWPADWTCVRVIRRGMFTSEESVEIFNKAMGFYIRVK